MSRSRAAGYLPFDEKARFDLLRRGTRIREDASEALRIGCLHRCARQTFEPL